MEFKQHSSLDQCEESKFQSLIGIKWNLNTGVYPAISGVFVSIPDRD